MADRDACVRALFLHALEFEPARRVAFVRSSVEHDTGIRREVEELLSLDQVGDARVDEPATSAIRGAGADATLLVGRRLGSYRLERCLAVGGMGAVYVARQENPPRRVAVKVLRADLATEELQRRFRVEAAFLARLQHAGIAHVYEADVATVDGTPVPYMAMELVQDARSITDHVREEGLSVEGRIELFLRICDAVHHGHQRGVIHRDLKPANVLIDGNGILKLIDFGVARAVEPEGATRPTDAGILVGTIQYMSPEQCVDARDIDVRSDVYSLGVMLFEIVCGIPPYETSGVALPHATRIVQERSPRRPSTILRTLRGDLETILLKALEKDREHRYQSVSDLREDLRRFLAREPILARPPSALHRLGLFARRHKLLSTALVTLFVVSLAASVVSSRFAWRERKAREREEYSAYVAGIAAADASLRVFDSAGARRSLEQAPVARRGWEWEHLNRRLVGWQREIQGPLPRCKGVVWRGGRIYSIWESVHPELAVVVHDAATGELVAGTGIRRGGSEGLCVTPDGKVIWTVEGRVEEGTGAVTPSLEVWDPADGSLENVPTEHTDRMIAIRLSAAGVVGTTSLDGTLHLRSLPDLRPTGALDIGSTAWGALDFGPEGRTVAVGGADHSVRVLDVATGSTVLCLEGHEAPVTAVAFRPDGEVLASGAADGTIRLWSLADGTTLDRFEAHASEVREVLFLEGLLLSASNDGTIRAWDLETGKQTNVLYGHENWVTGLAASPDGELVASGAFDGTLKIWSPRATPGVRKSTAHRGLVRDLAFSPDGRTLATASRDGTVALVDVETMSTIATLPHGSRVWSVAFDPDSSRLATGSDDPEVRLWDGRTGEPLAELAGHRAGVYSVAFSPDGRFLASSSWDLDVVVRDADSLETVATLPHEHLPKQIAFHPHLPRLATIDDGSSLRLWEVTSGRQLWCRTVDSAMHAVAFSPDGRWIATGEGRFQPGVQGVRLWDSGSGEELRFLYGHEDVVYDVAFSPDGRRLASASADGKVRLWDPAVGRELLALTGHKSWVWCVAFSPDGALLASGGGNYGGVGAGVIVWEGR